MIFILHHYFSSSLAIGSHSFHLNPLDHSAYLPISTMLFRTAFNNVARRSNQLTSRAFAAKAGQAEVVLVGCGAPNRGMGWYHGIQMLEGR